METIKVDIRKPTRNDQGKQYLHATYALSSLRGNIILKTTNVLLIVPNCQLWWI